MYINYIPGDGSSILLTGGEPWDRYLQGVWAKYYWYFTLIAALYGGRWVRGFEHEDTIPLAIHYGATSGTCENVTFQQ